jgi:uncharacterized membrane protein
VTNTVLQRTGADRGIAFAAYGLLAASLFTAGLTAAAGVVLAYASRGQVSPGVRRHLNAMIGMFWVALILWAACIGCAIAAAVIEVDDLARGSNDYLARLNIAGMSIDVSRWRLVPEVLGLVTTSLVTAAVGAVWTLIAPVIGVIRLASQDTKRETGQP